jgi:hypothetical protein
LEATELETQTEIPTIEETIVQTEGVLPTDFPTPLEKIEIGTQTDAPSTKEIFFQIKKVFQSLGQDAIISRLEEKLVQTQQTLTQCRSEMVKMS